MTPAAVALRKQVKPRKKEEHEEHEEQEKEQDDDQAKKHNKHARIVQLYCLDDSIPVPLSLLKLAKVWFADEVEDEVDHQQDHPPASGIQALPNDLLATPNDAVAYNVPLTCDAVLLYLKLATGKASPSSFCSSPQPPLGVEDEHARLAHLDKKDEEAAQLVAACAVLCSSADMSTSLLLEDAITDLARLAVARYRDLPPQEEQSKVCFTRSAVGAWLNMSGQWPREFGLLKLFAKYTVLRTNVWIRECLAREVLGLTQIVFVSGSSQHRDALAQLCVAPAVLCNDAPCDLHLAHAVAPLRATSATHWLCLDGNTSKTDAAASSLKAEEKQQHLPKTHFIDKSKEDEDDEDEDDDEDAWGVIDPLRYLYKGGVARDAHRSTALTASAGSDNAKSALVQTKKKPVFAIRRGEEIPVSKVLAEGSHASPCGRYVAVSFVNEHNNGTERAEICQLYRFPGTGDPIATITVCPSGLAQARFSSLLLPAQQPAQQTIQQSQQRASSDVDFVVVGKHGTVALYVLRLDHVVADLTNTFCVPQLLAHKSLPKSQVQSEATVAPLTLRAAATTRQSNLVVAVSTTGTLYVWSRCCCNGSTTDAFIGSSAAPRATAYVSKRKDDDVDCVDSRAQHVPVIRACDVAAMDAFSANTETHTVDREGDLSNATGTFSTIEAAATVFVLGWHQVKAPKMSSRSGESSKSSSRSFLALCWYTARISTKTVVKSSSVVCSFEYDPWIYADVLNLQDGDELASATCWALNASMVATGDDRGRVTMWCKQSGSRVMQSREGLIGREPVTNISVGLYVVAVAAGSFVYVVDATLTFVYRRIVAPGAKPFAWACPTVFSIQSINEPEP